MVINLNNTLSESLEASHVFIHPAVLNSENHCMSKRAETWERQAGLVSEEPGKVSKGIL